MTKFRVIASRLPDERRKKMAAVWHACEDAGVEFPRSVEEYFDGEVPGRPDSLVDFDLDQDASRYAVTYLPHGGLRVDLTKLPPDTVSLRILPVS